jgi:hypothetical protein
MYSTRRWMGDQYDHFFAEVFKGGEEDKLGTPSEWKTWYAWTPSNAVVIEGPFPSADQRPHANMHKNTFQVWMLWDAERSYGHDFHNPYDGSRYRYGLAFNPGPHIPPVKDDPRIHVGKAHGQITLWAPVRDRPERVNWTGCDTIRFEKVSAETLKRIVEADAENDKAQRATR